MSIAILGLLCLLIAAFLYQDRPQPVDLSPVIGLVDMQKTTLREINSHLQSIPNNPLPPRARKQLIKELQTQMAKYDQTLATLAKGGSMPGPDGTLVTVPDFQSPKLDQSIASLSKIWRPMKEQLISLLRALNRPGISEVRSITESLLRAMDSQASNLGRGNAELSEAVRGNATSGHLATSAIALGVMGGCLLLTALLKVLLWDRTTTASRKKPVSTNAASPGLMSVLEGNMLVFDRDQVVSNQFTKGAAAVFGKDDLAGEKLYELLSSIVPADLAPALNKYIELLFDDSKVESLITSLNPLVEFETVAQVDRDLGTLGFRFRRLPQDDGVASVLLMIESKHTQETNHSTPNAPAVASSGSLSVFDALLGIDGDILADFAHSTRHSLERINNTLKSPLEDSTTPTPQLKEKTKALLIEMHRLKGDFAAMDLEPLVLQAQEFEDETRELASQDELHGDDFLPLTIRLKDLMAYADAFDKLLLKLGHEEVPTLETRADRWQHLKTLSHKVAEDVGKNVELTATGLNEYPLNEDQRELVNDICIQLIRNAVVHGIEDGDERKSSGKATIGRIDVSLTRVSDKQMELSIRDDGGGIDFEGIRQRAADKGLVSAEKLASWTNRQLFNLLFRPEFSTARTHSQHAGQGVGLNVIRDRVKSAGGEIAVWTRKGRYSQFKVSLPINENIESQEGEQLSCVS